MGVLKPGSAGWKVAPKGPRKPRVLIYSHDTFGLGHLRRSRAIANAIVQAEPDTSVMIISGSPVIGSFEFGNGVDFVRVPGVVKLPNGDYTSLSTSILDSTKPSRCARRSSAAPRQCCSPDVIIVDKEPTGFRGEIIPTLEAAKARGARLVLGIRDVMDEPALLVPEWERKGAVEAMVATTTISGSTGWRRSTSRSLRWTSQPKPTPDRSIPAICAANFLTNPT